MHFFAILFATICALSFDFAYGGGHGGGGPGLVMISNNKPRRHGTGDLLMFNNGCGTGIIKDGGRKGKNILVIPQCQNKKIIKKIEYKTIPVPVKEYIPVPMKEMHGYSEMGAMGGMGMDSMQMPVQMPYSDQRMTMETKTTAIHASPDEEQQQPEQPSRPVARKVIKIRRNRNID